jgi:hypothetical protein
MSPRKRTAAFRFGDELIGRIDAYAAQLAALAGVPVSRTAAAIKLLTEQLDWVEKKPKPKR